MAARVIMATGEGPEEAEATAAFLSLPGRLERMGIVARGGDDALSDLLPIIGHTDVASSDGSHLMALVVALDGQGDPCARAAAFLHDEDEETCHVGFFESDGDQGAVDALFEQVRSFARGLGARRISGPMDRSIWNEYRFKTDGFDRVPYLGEPTNPQAYPSLWEAAGLKVTDVWHSYEIPSQAGRPAPKKLQARLRRAQDLGYEIRHMSTLRFGQELREVHGLVVDLYSGFPGFTAITYEGFEKKLAAMRFLGDMRATFLARKDGELVGFLFALPDYALVASTGVVGAFGMARMRLRPTRYSILYTGVARGHEGLAGAMMELLRQRSVERDAQGVAALIHEGMTSAAYVDALGGGMTHTYALYADEL